MAVHTNDNEELHTEKQRKDYSNDKNSFNTGTAKRINASDEVDSNRSGTISVHSSDSSIRLTSAAAQENYSDRATNKVSADAHQATSTGAARSTSYERTASSSYTNERQPESYHVQQKDLNVNSDNANTFAQDMREMRQNRAMWSNNSKNRSEEQEAADNALWHLTSAAERLSNNLDRRLDEKQAEYDSEAGLSDEEEQIIGQTFGPMDAKTHEKYQQKQQVKEAITRRMAEHQKEKFNPSNGGKFETKNDRAFNTDKNDPSFANAFIEDENGNPLDKMRFGYDQGKRHVENDNNTQHEAPEVIRQSDAYKGYQEIKKDMLNLGLTKNNAHARDSAIHFLTSSKKKKYTVTDAEKIMGHKGMPGSDRKYYTEGEMLKILLGDEYMTRAGRGTNGIRGMASNNDVLLNRYLERHHINGSALKAKDIEKALKTGTIGAGTGAIHLDATERFILQEKLNVTRAREKVRFANDESPLNNMVSGYFEDTDFAQGLNMANRTVKAGKAAVSATKAVNKAGAHAVVGTASAIDKTIGGALHATFSASTGKEKWTVAFKEHKAIVEKRELGAKKLASKIVDKPLETGIRGIGKGIGKAAGKGKNAVSKRMAEARKRQMQKKVMKQAAKKAMDKGMKLTKLLGGVKIGVAAPLLILCLFGFMVVTFLFMSNPGGGFPGNVGLFFKTVGGTIGNAFNNSAAAAAAGSDEGAGALGLSGDAGASTPTIPDNTDSDANPTAETYTMDEQRANNMYNTTLQDFNEYIIRMKATYMNEWNSRHNGIPEEENLNKENLVDETEATGPKAIAVNFRYMAAPFESGTGKNNAYVEVTEDDFYKALISTSIAATGDSSTDKDFFRGYFNDIGMAIMEHPLYDTYKTKYRNPEHEVESFAEIGHPTDTIKLTGDTYKVREGDTIVEKPRDGTTIICTFVLCNTKGIAKGTIETARGVKYQVNLHQKGVDGKKDKNGNVKLAYPTYDDKTQHISMSGTEDYVDRKYVIAADRLEEDFGGANNYMHIYGKYDYQQEKGGSIYSPVDDYNSRTATWDDWTEQGTADKYEGFSPTAIYAENYGEAEGDGTASSIFNGPSLLDWTDWGINFPDMYTGLDGELHFSSWDNGTTRNTSHGKVKAYGGYGSPLSDGFKESIMADVLTAFPDLSEKRQKDLRRGLDLIGYTKYVVGVSDCSATVSKALGIGHTATSGFITMAQNGQLVLRKSLEDLVPGDILIAHQYGSDVKNGKYVGIYDHVVLYYGQTSLGNFTIMESSNAGYGIQSGPSIKGFESWKDFALSESAGQFADDGIGWNIAGYLKDRPAN